MMVCRLMYIIASSGLEYYLLASCVHNVMKISMKSSIDKLQMDRGCYMFTILAY